MRKELINFVNNEVSAEEQKVLETHNRSVRSRVKAGECISGLTYKGTDSSGLLVYAYKENLSKFRAGDLLVINEGKPQGEDILKKGVPVYLYEIDSSKRRIKLEKEYYGEAPSGTSCTLDKAFIDYNSALLRQSIEQAYESKEVIKFLDGRAELKDPRSLCSTQIKFDCQDFSELTEYQQRALSVVACGSHTLIQGPPGSGKSYLLSAIIKSALRSGKSILVTAPSHKAIDTLLEAVVKRIPDRDWPVFKIKERGKPSKCSGEIYQTTCDELARLDLESEAPYVIGATVYQAYKMRRCGLSKFDLVVIDEAGQMTIAQSMPALLSGDQYVIAGDHKQLSPVISNAIAHPEHLKQSAFEYFNDKYLHATTTLDVTFRMNEGINEFPNEEFYSGLLQPSDAAAARFFAPKSDAVGALNDWICKRGAVTFVELDHNDASQRSSSEADVVAKLASELLLHHGISPDELAIVSPHRVHNGDIRARLIAHLGIDLSMQSKVQDSTVIDTVDRLQGQEKDVIIYSLCASDRKYLLKRAQFLYSPNRLNVAITRSRTKLFVVGSKYFFPHISGIIIDAQHLRTWVSYYSYLSINGLIVRDERRTQSAYAPDRYLQASS